MAKGDRKKQRVEPEKPRKGASKGATVSDDLEQEAADA